MMMVGGDDNDGTTVLGTHRHTSARAQFAKKVDPIMTRVKKPFQPV